MNKWVAPKTCFCPRLELWITAIYHQSEKWQQSSHQDFLQSKSMAHYRKFVNKGNQKEWESPMVLSCNFLAFKIASLLPQDQRQMLGLSLTNHFFLILLFLLLLHFSFHMLLIQHCMVLGFYSVPAFWTNLPKHTCHFCKHWFWGNKRYFKLSELISLNIAGKGGQSRTKHRLGEADVSIIPVPNNASCEHIF